MCGDSSVSFVSINVRTGDRKEWEQKKCHSDGGSFFSSRLMLNFKASNSNAFESSNEVWFNSQEQDASAEEIMWNIFVYRLNANKQVNRKLSPKTPSFKTSYIQIIQNGFDASLIVCYFLFGFLSSVFLFCWLSSLVECCVECASFANDNDGPRHMLSIVANNWITHTNSMEKSIICCECIQMAGVPFVCTLCLFVETPHIFDGDDDWKDETLT